MLQIDPSNGKQSPFQGLQREIEMQFAHTIRIINLTQHNAATEQVSAGVQDLLDDGSVVKRLLTLSERELVAPAAELKANLSERAATIAVIAHRLGYTAAMIGGHPLLMVYLGRALKAKGVDAYIAISERVSVDGPNGTKTSVFKHLGFCPWDLELLEPACSQCGGCGGATGLGGLDGYEGSCHAGPYKT